MAAEGAQVVLADISGRQDELASSIGDAVVAVHCDVTETDDLAAAVALAEERFGGLHVVVNNAGAGQERMPLAQIDEAMFDQVLSLKLRSVFLGMRHGIPALLRSGGGAIVNVASAAGLVGWQ